VKETYQGAFAPDPNRLEYEDGYYLRGSQPAEDNYGFELYVNIDNGTTNFGLLRHDVMTNQNYIPEGVIEPTQTTIVVDTVEEIPNPFTRFIVLAITNPNTPERKEYVQVVGVDADTLTLTVIRGVYGTTQEQDWPDNSVLSLQVQSTEILPQDYDFDWAPSKLALLRFFEVMGYSREAMAPILLPKARSFRNITLDTITLSPKEGYALSTGPWPLSFTQSSQLDVISHSFHSVGRLSYSRGLPRYLDNEFATKQYYDYLCTAIWGGTALVTGGDEKGNLPQSGQATQISTGRPVGSYTSEITGFTRINPGGEDQGGGGEATGVTAVFTGQGLGGGPIFREGIIFLEPPKNDDIGGVKAGQNITIDADGVISSTGGSLEDTNVELPLYYDIDTATLGLNIGTGLGVNVGGELFVAPGTVDTVGGVKEGVATSISPEGAISVLPPTGPFIGGVKAGTGVTISPDGTISVDSPVPPPGGSVVLLDNLGPSFNGVLSSFSLTSQGVPYAPSNPESVLISVGGVVQGANLGYTISGSTIQFTSPPPAGADFYGIGLDGTLAALKTAGYPITPLDDISSQFNGTTVQFNLSNGGVPVTPTAAYFALIVLGGIIQSTPTSYNVTGSIISFTAPPPAGTSFYGLSLG
jgi:hypothetical protein